MPSFVLQVHGVVFDFDGTYYTVNDPANKWCEVYGDGCCYGAYPAIGKYVKYRKEVFEAAISRDGYCGYMSFIFLDKMTFASV
jgi:hypothetical protein